MKCWTARVRALINSLSNCLEVTLSSNIINARCFGGQHDRDEGQLVVKMIVSVILIAMMFPYWIVRVTRPLIPDTPKHYIMWVQPIAGMPGSFLLFWLDLVCFVDFLSSLLFFPSCLRSFLVCAHCQCRGTRTAYDTLHLSTAAKATAPWHVHIVLYVWKALSSKDLYLENSVHRLHWVHICVQYK